MDQAIVPGAAAADTPSGSAPDDQPLAPRGFITRIALAEFGLFGALLTPVLVTLALRVAQVSPQTKTADLSLVLTIGAFVALVVNPLVGRLSDRTTSRFGRRRPWLIGGVLIGFLGLLIIALVPSIPAIACGWALAQIAYNASLAALQATVPDQVPSRQLGKVSGVLGIALTLSIVASSQLAAVFSDVKVQFLVPALAAIVLVGWFAVKLPDRRLESRPAPFSVREFLSSFWTNPVRHRDFGWAWVSKFLVMFGMVAPASYLAYYLMADFGVSAGEVAGKVALLVVISYACNATMAAFSGWLSDRLGVRKPFVIGSSLVIVAGLVVLAFAGDFTMLLVSQILVGIGGGMFYAVDMALVTEVLPDQQAAAKDLGVMNIANALPQTLAPMLAGVLLAVGGGDNYTLFFAVAAAVTLVGALCVTRIRGVR
ncbi:MFS transporter [Streptomyces sp. NPDC004542]|uniref:MFS transporter n=1 Tax=Streptomyces sp. NPDC004542 TaxID=3154281 RepID=UPI0033A1B099